MSEVARVYLGLGANLAEPIQQLQQAIVALKQLPQSQWIGASRFYGSTPMGPSDQPDYVNAVACLDTTLTPLDLLDALQRIEADQGRDRSGVRWGARTLDLDILLYGQQVIANERLNVPHIGAHERVFVLAPLCELAPEIEIPNKGAAKKLLDALPEAGIWPLELE